MTAPRLSPSAEAEIREAAAFPPTWPHARALTEAEARTVETDLMLRRGVVVLLAELDAVREERDRARNVMEQIAVSGALWSSKLAREWLAACPAVTDPKGER